MPHKDPEKRRECNLRNVKAWNERNPEERKRRARERMRQYRIDHPDRVVASQNKSNAAGQAWWNEYKSGLQCIKCGEKHFACLEFHHRNPEDKEIKISEYTRGSITQPMRAKLLKEIEKCEVLCANCHRKEHFPPEDSQ